MIKLISYRQVDIEPRLKPDSFKMLRFSQVLVPFVEDKTLT